MFGRVLAALIAWVAPTAASARQPMVLLVPAYFYPNAKGSDWDRMTQAAASGVPIVAIMNPGTGPGDTRDPNYVRAVGAFRAAGGKVLGYLPSSYAGRLMATPSASCKPADVRRYTSDDIVACARRYRTFYSIDGLFVDEMGGEAVGASTDDVVAFYTRVYDGLKGIDPAWRIVGNPGAPASGRLLRRDDNEGGADALVTFEGLAANFPASPLVRHETHDVGAILIEIDPAFDVVASLADATARRVGLYYATDGVLPNPYDRLPSDWDKLLQAIRAFNATATR